MKNLLIYTGPNKNFTQEDNVLAKIQIDNSLDLGWEKQDLLLVTDFPYQYKGVSSVVIPDKTYYEFDKNANKVPVILYLLKQKLLDPKEIYWCHDLDAYQLNSITLDEINMNQTDLALTHYTYKPEWQFSSFFFNTNSKDIFQLLDDETRARPHQSRNNEKTLTKLINQNKIKAKRYKRLNVTYNITKRCIATIYPLADKPLKVLHFRPSDKDYQMTDTALNMFMYGKNRLKIPLMNDRLIKIFHHHGIK